MGIYKTSLSGSERQHRLLPAAAHAPLRTTRRLNSANNTNLITNTQAAFQPERLDARSGGSQRALYQPRAGGSDWATQDFLYLPWQRHFDLELQKNTRIKEKVNLQIAASALDVLNMTNFLPGAVAGNTTASTVRPNHCGVSRYFGHG